MLPEHALIIFQYCLIVLATLLLGLNSTVGYRLSAVYGSVQVLLIMSPSLLTTAYVERNMRSITGFTLVLPCLLQVIMLCSMLYNTSKYSSIYEQVQKYADEKPNLHLVDLQNMFVMQFLGKSPLARFDVGNTFVDVYLDGEYLFSHRDPVWFKVGLGIREDARNGYQEDLDPLLVTCEMEVRGKLGRNILR